MVNKDKIMLAAAGVGLVVLAVVLVWQLRPKNAPPAVAAAAQTSPDDLRRTWDGILRTLEHGEQSDEAAAGEAAFQLPRRDPFQVSQLLRDRFGRKPDVDGPATRPAGGSASDPERERQRRREQMIRRMTERIEHFRKTCTVGGILDGVAVINGELVRIGDRIEECTVTEISAEAVVLAGAVTDAPAETVFECSTFEVDGKPAAKVQGAILHVGDRFKDSVVHQIAPGRIVLRKADDAQSQPIEPMSFTVRLPVAQP